MTKEEKLNNLYILNKSFLTTSDLLNCGFTKKDITQYNGEFFNRIKKGQYVIDIEHLYMEAIKLLDNEEIRAKNSFLTCLEQNPLHWQSALQLFILELKNNHMFECLKYFDIYYKYNNEAYNANLYLFLLDLIIDLPEKYSKVKHINLGDIEVTKFDRYMNCDLANMIRSKILDCKLTKALDLLKKYNQMYPMEKERNEVLKFLLEKATLKEKSHKNIVKDIINMLRNNDKKAIDTIHNYLVKIDALEYEKLLLLLIKLSSLKRDLNYVYFENALNGINNKTLEFEEEIYINRFRNALNKGATGEAQIYLDILALNNNLGLVEELKQELKEKKELNLTNFTWLNKYLEPYIKALRNNEDVVLLNIISIEKMEQIIKYVRKISDIRYFIIGKDNKKQLVLKKHDSNINIPDKELAQRIKETYRTDLKKNMEYCSLMIRKKEMPQAYCFAYIGLNFFRLKKPQKAIPYLTIATNMPNSRYDFSDLIFTLENHIPPKYQKNHVKMREKEFIQDQYYGIPFIENILIFVMEEGKTIQDACQAFQLNEEQIMLTKLIFAREYYFMNMISLADKLMKEIERTANKPQSVKILLEEIKKNKKVYQNNRGKARSLQLYKR